MRIPSPSRQIAEPRSTAPRRNSPAGQRQRGQNIVQPTDSAQRSIAPHAHCVTDCPRSDPPALDGWTSSLAGLECLTNVETVMFDSYYVRDFTPLSALPKLQRLYLGLAPDSWSLPPLPQVRDFGVYYTRGSLSGLTSLPNVTSLEMKAADLSAADALEPIAKMKNLKPLHLAGSHVRSVSALAGLTQLVDVDLAVNDIVDLSPLARTAALGAGTMIELVSNPIDCDRDASVHALRARGVVVHCN